jgi:glycerol uptake facilitator-like aquaporin
MGGPVTGASMNPARSLGPALTADLWREHWIYWLAPITAMIVAAQVYELLSSVDAPRVFSFHRPRCSRPHCHP